MTLGKKERMVAVIVVIAGLAAAIHFLIFANKARTYEQTRTEYADAQTKLGAAEFIVGDGQDQTAAFAEYQQLTSQYDSLVTSVVGELNLEKVDIGTSPPVGALDQWASGTIELLNQLNAQRNGRVKLTFLDQTGWNLTPQLPAAGAVGALADRVSQLVQIYPQLQYTTEVWQQAQARNNYNARLQAVGVPPEETSYFFYPQQRLFFNDITWLLNAMKGPGGQAASNNNLSAFYNPYGLQRFGIAIPAIKKIWVYNLISQELQRQGNTGNIDLQSLGVALEIGLPLDSPEPLNSINKQLKGVLDMIGIAERTGVTEILSVKFQRPINVAKASLFVPGATPPPTVTPAPTPAMGMGGMEFGMDPALMDFGGGAQAGTAVVQVTPVPDAESVGTGAGIELDLRGDNTALTRFYFEVSHLNRSYGIDELYYFTEPNGALRTTSTIEIITAVKLDAAPVAEVPVQ